MLSAEQWAEWMEYAALEPFGPGVDDLRFALLNTTIGLAAGAKGLKPEMFMLGLRDDDDEPEQSMQERIRAVLGAHGAHSSSETTR